MDFKFLTKAFFLKNLLLIIKLGSLFFILLFISGIIYYLRELKIIPQWLKICRLFLQEKKVSSQKVKKTWEKIKNLLKENYESSWKLAVIKTDNLFDNTLQEIGYSGVTPEQRLAYLKPWHLSVHDKVLQAHQIRNELVANPLFSLTKNQAEEILSVYQEAFKEFGLLD